MRHTVADRQNTAARIRETLPRRLEQIQPASAEAPSCDTRQAKRNEGALPARSRLRIALCLPRRQGGFEGGANLPPMLV